MEVFLWCAGRARRIRCFCGPYARRTSRFQEAHRVAGARSPAFGLSLALYDLGRRFASLRRPSGHCQGRAIVVSCTYRLFWEILTMRTNLRAVFLSLMAIAASML